VVLKAQKCWAWDPGGDVCTWDKAERRAVGWTHRHTERFVKCPGSKTSRGGGGGEAGRGKGVRSCSRVVQGRAGWGMRVWLSRDGAALEAGECWGHVTGSGGYGKAGAVQLWEWGDGDREDERQWRRGCALQTGERSPVGNKEGTKHEVRKRGLTGRSGAHTAQSKALHSPLAGSGRAASETAPLLPAPASPPSRLCPPQDSPSPPHALGIPERSCQRGCVDACGCSVAQSRQRKARNRLARAGPTRGSRSVAHQSPEGSRLPAANRSSLGQRGLPKELFGDAFSRVPQHCLFPLQYSHYTLEENVSPPAVQASRLSLPQSPVSPWQAAGLALSLLHPETGTRGKESPAHGLQETELQVHHFQGSH